MLCEVQTPCASAALPPNWMPSGQHPPFFFSGASRSVGRPPPDRRKEPSRAKLVRLASKAAVTPHSFSRRCFRSRQAAKAQPTAWLSLSPCGKIGQAGRQSPGCHPLGVSGDPGQVPRPHLGPPCASAPGGTQMTAPSENSQKQECSAVWLPLYEVLTPAKLIYGGKSPKRGCSLGGRGGVGTDWEGAGGLVGVEECSRS